MPDFKNDVYQKGQKLDDTYAPKVHGHDAASTSAAGFLSAADKTKLDGIATGANNYTHPISGVAAGTYKSVTVNTAGHVTAGTNPTTLSGYGITDAYTKTAVDTLIAAVPGSTSDSILAAENTFTGQINSFKDLYAETVRVTRLPLMDDTHEFEYGAGYAPVHHRTGTATYLTTAGTLATAGDGVARIGLPWVVRRNLFASSTWLTSPWAYNRGTLTQNQAKAPDGSYTASLFITTDTAENYAWQAINNQPASATHAFSVYAKRGTTDYVVLMGYDNTTNGARVWFNLVSGTVGSNTAFGTGWSATGTIQDVGDGWYRLTGVFVGASGSTRVYRCGAANADSFTTSSVGKTVYFWGAQVELGGAVTPPQPTNATGVDLTHPLNGAGLVLDGNGANLLSANQSDIETDTSGISALGSTPAVISRVTTEKYTGNASLQVVCNGAVNDQGAAWAVNTSTHGTYCGQAMVKGPAGAVLSVWMRARYSDASQENMPATALTLDGGWKFISPTTITTNSGKTLVAVELHIRTPVAVALTFYCDTLKIEANPFPTSWHLGGTTRQPDLCGIVPPHNLLKWSEGLDSAVWVKGDGTNRITVSPNAVAAPDGTMTADRLDLAAGTAAGGTPDDVVQTVSAASATRTLSIWMRAISGTVGIRLLNRGAGASSLITLTTDWQRVYFTNTTADPAAGFDFNNSTGSASIAVWGAQLVEGSHPGIYVKTTDTPIPAPVSPALDPAWQQNGRIRFRVLPPPISTGKNYNLFGPESRDTVTAAVLRFFRLGNSLTNNATLYYDRKHNGATGSSSVAGRGVVESGTSSIFYDGAPHDVILEWTNEVNEATGVREMWQRLYVDYDGVDAAGNPIPKLVAQQDVAALYGATAWAEIDPSRLVSDGNVFSTLSSLELQYPVPLAGYWLP